MKKEEISSVNAIVYHIVNISKSWQLNNPYFVALRNILLEKFDTPKDIRSQQEFHFIAKVIADELKNNKSEIRNNTKKISDFLSNYIKERNQKNGDEALRLIFNILILKLLNRKGHFNNLNQNKVKEFLSLYQTQKSNFKNFQKILSLVHSVDQQGTEEYINDDLDLALNLLYSRLLFNEESKRDNNKLVDYYLKQTRLEKIETTTSSERTKGNLLEIALILKATTGKGLYIPEIEKEQYLSRFTKTLFREKYINILKETNSVKIFNFKLPNWVVVLSFFTLEAIVFALPNFVESLSFGTFSISTGALMQLPLWVILIINGIIISLYLFLLQRRANKRIGDEKWK